MDHRAAQREHLELLMRKLGHEPSQGYVLGGRYQDSLRCLLCGYQERVYDADDGDIAACLVEQNAVREEDGVAA